MCVHDRLSSPRRGHDVHRLEYVEKNRRVMQPTSAQRALVAALLEAYRADLAASGTNEELPERHATAA